MHPNEWGKDGGGVSGRALDVKLVCDNIRGHINSQGRAVAVGRRRDDFLTSFRE